MSGLYYCGVLFAGVSSGPHSTDRAFRGLGRVGAFSAARPLAGTARRVLAQKARYLVRDAIEAFIGRLYFGSVVPLDPTSPSFPATRRRHSTQSDDDPLPKARSSAMEWATNCRTRRDSGKSASGRSATGPI